MRREPPTGGIYSVALTKRNAIVVIRHDSDGGIREFRHYDSFMQLVLNLANDGHYHTYPRPLIAAVADELGIEYIEEMDI